MATKFLGGHFGEGFERCLSNARQLLLGLVRYPLGNVLLEALQGFLQLRLETFQQSIRLPLQPFHR